MRSLRKWGRTGPGVIPRALLAAAAVWFGYSALAASRAAEGRDTVVARAVEPGELERQPTPAPWGPVSPRIDLPAAGPLPKTPAGPDAAAPQPTDEELLDRLAQWLRLTDDGETLSFDEISGFVRANPAWPRLGALRNKAERAITKDDSDRSIMTWFRAYPPRTVEGATAYALALERNGRADEALAVVRRAWVAFDMGAADEKAFLSRFGRHLEPEHHWARLDRQLWNNRRTAAKRQKKRVGGEYQALAEARLRMMRRRRNAESALAAVPDWLSKDPGLNYEWVRWNRRKDKDDAAIKALLAFEGDPGDPKRWWTERQILARRALLNDDAATAYRLAREHGLDGGVARADAEFLAGWIALRFLGNPRTAFNHFSELYETVRYPISRARAAYWTGRAAEAAGEAQIARQWFRTASQFTTTFYGQLAARRIGIDAAHLPPREPEISLAARAEFDRDELVRAVRLLVALRNAPAEAARDAAGRGDGDDDPRRLLAGQHEDRVLKPFLRQIAWQSKNPEQWTLAARLARDSGRVDIAVYIARRAARDGVVLKELGYPTIMLADDVPPEPALVHALIRQESAFDAAARSRAGARGLMQLMPATAKRVARKLRVKNHSTARLTSDPEHNVVLGGAYLESMLARYEGSMVMALAAYNAGPHRVDQWLIDYGDPRGRLEDAIDWIESIPFSETRNYVQRVMEALPIYRQKLNGTQVAFLRAEDIAGRLPGYLAPTKP